MVSDPEAIAREILRLKAARDTSAELSHASPKRQNDAFALLTASGGAAPTLAAAYLDLRATSAEALEAERIRCTRQADRDAARRDAAYLAAYLDLRAQLDAVTAQRDELREAGHAAIAVMVSVDPMDRSDARRSAVERLAKALEAAR